MRKILPRTHLAGVARARSLPSGGLLAIETIEVSMPTALMFVMGSHSNHAMQLL